jgi:hypothetical protein
MRVKVPAGAARPNETDAPPPNAVEEVLLDENRRRQELNSTFYMVRRSSTCSARNQAFVPSNDE